MSSKSEKGPTKSGKDWLESEAGVYKKEGVNISGYVLCDVPEDFSNQNWQNL